MFFFAKPSGVQHTLEDHSIQKTKKNMTWKCPFFISCQFVSYLKMEDQQSNPAPCKNPWLMVQGWLVVPCVFWNERSGSHSPLSSSGRQTWQMVVVDGDGDGGCRSDLEFQFASIMFHNVPSCSIMFHHVPSCSIMFHHVPSCSIRILVNITWIFAPYLALGCQRFRP